MTNRLRPTAAGWLWLALCSVWALSFFYSGSPLDDTIWCVWRRLTGLNCAGCGLTRSFCAMSAMAFLEAFAHHPVGPFLYAAMVTHIILSALRHLRRDPHHYRIGPLWVQRFWVAVAIVFGVHLIRTILSWV
jgi:hypothetical protein